MSTSSYFLHHKELIQALYQFCLQQPPFCNDRANETDIECLTMLKDISEASEQNEEFQQNGQSVITRIVTHYPHITPNVSRDLFWFFGGECLHYMADDELSQYQQLDELLHQPSSSPIDYSEAKSRVFKLH